MRDAIIAKRFLADLQPRPFQFARDVDLIPVGVLFGHGQKPLEVVIARALRRPGYCLLMDGWRAWLGNRYGYTTDEYVVLVVLFKSRAAICAPHPQRIRVGAKFDVVMYTLTGLLPSQVEHICRVALNQPDLDAALQSLWQWTRGLPKKPS